jgi:hypothetical protein
VALWLRPKAAVRAAACSAHADDVETNDPAFRARLTQAVSPSGEAHRIAAAQGVRAEFPPTELKRRSAAAVSSSAPSIVGSPE